MNSRTVIGWVSLVALGIAGATAVVYAGGDGGKPRGSEGRPGPGPGLAFPGGPGMMAPHRLHRLADELELTPEQRSTIKALLESARPGMQALQEETRAVAGQLRGTRPDAGNYNTVVEQASRKAGEMASRFVTESSQLRSQVWQVLTPEQRAKFQTLGEKFHERMRDRGPRRGPPPPQKGAMEGTSLTRNLSAGTLQILDTLPVIEVRATRL